MARALSGGAVYVSDKPGEHDLPLLRQLVLPDGRILRGLLPGRPTRDALFADVLRDGRSLAKVWNANSYTGAVGVFHLQARLAFLGRLGRNAGGEGGREWAGGGGCAALRACARAAKLAGAAPLFA